MILVKPSFKILANLHHTCDAISLLEYAGRTCYKSESNFVDYEPMTEEKISFYIKGLPQQDCQPWGPISYGEEWRREIPLVRDRLIRLGFLSEIE